MGIAVELRPDCTRCFGLCCVAPAFAASADFAIDKPPGQPCPHLAADFRCDIHERLRPEGFSGCAAYDCHGAGQHLSQGAGGGRSWRSLPGDARAGLFAAFGVMRQLHELLVYLAEASTLVAAAPVGAAALVGAEVQATIQATAALTEGTVAELLALDLAQHRAVVNEVLLRASHLARSGAVQGEAADYRGARLIGADLRRTILRGASLRGACLIGARLSGVDLTLADVTGADLRGADLAGADASKTLFLLQAQVDSARGDGRTRLPRHLHRPAHWG